MSGFSKLPAIPVKQAVRKYSTAPVRVCSLNAGLPASRRCAWKARISDST